MKIRGGGSCVFSFFVMLESHIARSIRRLSGWWEREGWRRDKVARTHARTLTTDE